MEKKISYAEATKHFKEATKVEEKTNSKESSTNDNSKVPTNKEKKETKSKTIPTQSRPNTDSTQYIEIETNQSESFITPSVFVEQGRMQHSNSGGHGKPNIITTAKNTDLPGRSHISLDLLMFLFRVIEIMQQDIPQTQKMNKFLAEAQTCLNILPKELEIMKHHGEHN